MTWDRWPPLALILVGVVLLAAAVTYFVVPAQGLPSFMGFIPGSDVIRWKRGLGSLVVGLICLVVGVIRVRRDLGKSP
jgi:amino acid permease